MKKDTGEFRIYHKKLGIGKHKQQFNIDGKFFQSFEYSEIEKGEILVNTDIEVRNSVVIVDLQMSGTVEVQCDVCLENFDMKFTNQVLLTFKFAQAPTNPYFDDEIIYLSNNDDYIDLRKILYDYIILALPIKKVHPEDENGHRTCNPEILKRLEQVNHHEVSKLSVKNSDVWEDLKKLYN